MNNNKISKCLKINDSSISHLDEKHDLENIDKSLKYEINPDKLDEYFEDLLLLEDWIPFEIIRCLPRERAFKFTRGEKVKNKQLWKERIKEHEIANLGLDAVDHYNGEIETFIRKYPGFKSIFVEI
ncbi:hypothetical protein [uncultured Methanobrevibacter sp.]|uniref:hypothetical protein n=1 Tax=uncultured Methanobrevibacter sp. TaxID=253161 RepID=UPI0026E0BF2F|nr:hypothetical protein [uncultured Methanobrevibacter sp.]